MQVDKTIQDYIKEELKKFQQRYLSFRAFKTTDRPVDSFGINNRNGTGSVPNNSVGTAQLVASSVTQAKIASNAVGQGQLKYEQATVTVTAGNNTGTASVTSGDIIIGYYPSTNQDQFVKSIAIASTTLTITLLNNATANNVFVVTLLKS